MATSFYVILILGNANRTFVTFTLNEQNVWKVGRNSCKNCRGMRGEMRRFPTHFLGIADRNDHQHTELRPGALH
jgi:hypothetical protein